MPLPSYTHRDSVLDFSKTAKNAFQKYFWLFQKVGFSIASSIYLHQLSLEVGSPQIDISWHQWVFSSCSDAKALAKHLLHVLSLPEEKWQKLSDQADKTATRATGYTWDDATNLFEPGLQKAIERDIAHR